MQETGLFDSMTHIFQKKPQRKKVKFRHCWETLKEHVEGALKMEEREVEVFVERASQWGVIDFGQFRLRPACFFDFGQYRLRPISTSANFDFGQFRLRPIFRC